MKNRPFFDDTALKKWSLRNGYAPIFRLVSSKNWRFFPRNPNPQQALSSSAELFDTWCTGDFSRRYKCAPKKCRINHPDYLSSANALLPEPHIQSLSILLTGANSQQLNICLTCTATKYGGENGSSSGYAILLPERALCRNGCKGPGTVESASRAKKTGSSNKIIAFWKRSHSTCLYRLKQKHSMKKSTSTIPVQRQGRSRPLFFHASQPEWVTFTRLAV